jgi:hypothetical protein
MKVICDSSKIFHFLRPYTYLGSVPLVDPSGLKYFIQAPTPHPAPLTAVSKILIFDETTNN